MRLADRDDLVPIENVRVKVPRRAWIWSWAPELEPDAGGIANRRNTGGYTVRKIMLQFNECRRK